jgi:hypothetical protein
MKEAEKQPRPAEEGVPESTKVVDDSQAPRNEAQQQPSRSGDPRTSNAVGVPLPYGVPTDDLHPITQPQGDASDPTSLPPGTSELPRKREKKSA